MRKLEHYPVPNVDEFFEKLTSWASKYSHFLLLNSNSFEGDGILKKDYDRIAAIGSLSNICVSENCFQKLKTYHTEIQDWIFGYISYDAKNDIENLVSENQDYLSFPTLQFFQPKIVITSENNNIAVHYPPSQRKPEIDVMISSILGCQIKNEKPSYLLQPFNPRINKEAYIKKVEKLIWHIQRGDIYEVNFCQEFYSKDATLDSPNLFWQLNNISPAPFSCYGKFENNYVLSTSPERFLKKRGNKIYSQPIKGTCNRSIDTIEDEQLKYNLQHDSKERSENIMIVDLVRNDLSKVAEKESVKVEELCKIYSFKYVHQMISTISASLASSINEVDVIKACFPMGSMTGAPKVSAMKLIEQFETTKRGVYSGTIGYFNPNGDFDFNVIIRSLLYNTTNNYLSFMVGSAITAKSDPKKEYEECLLKAKAFFNLFEKNKNVKAI